MSASEIIFWVTEDETDGGYSASAVGHAIHTEGDSIEELRANVKDAVDCHFDDNTSKPRLIRLHFERDPVPQESRGLDAEGELLRLALAGEVQLGRPNDAALYTRPPRDQRLPHDEVMALLDAVRGER